MSTLQAREYWQQREIRVPEKVRISVRDFRGNSAGKLYVTPTVAKGVSGRLWFEVRGRH
jgi:hypothetical protein